MKQIAFALQVFALIVMLPLYVIVEMNHNTETSTENNSVIKSTGEIKNSSAVYIQRQGFKVKI